MKSPVITTLLLAAVGATTTSAAPSSSGSNSYNNGTTTGGTVKDLYVTEAPQSPRPYILPKSGGRNVRLGNQIYRFSVTGNASAGAFTLMQTNAPASSSLGVLPHIHRTHHENFYCTKGRVQLWAQKTNSSSSADEQATRVLTQGDYGAVPQGTIHTFQMLDPDTQLTGVIHPGGFEALFLAIGEEPYDSPNGSPFIPRDLNVSSDPSLISSLQAFDVWAELDFVPRTDAVDGKAGGANGSSWHAIGQKNELARDDKTPNFVAKNYGPKYLHTDARTGVYSIVAPLVRSQQSGGNFSMGTISMSPLLLTNNATTAPQAKRLGEHTAFQLEEGELVVQVDGFEGEARLIQGDVVFLPQGTGVVYYAAVPFTKFLYVAAGSGGVAEELIAGNGTVAWDFASYPQY